MTLIGRSGSFAQISSQSAKLLETDRVQPDNQAAATDKDVMQLQHISDTFTTRTAINAQRYSDEYAGIALFVEGSPIIVTFYHQNMSEIDIKSMPSDISPKAHPVHKDITKIVYFEMRLLDSLQSSYTEDHNNFVVTGEVVTYPGFTPYIGDLFTLEMGDNKIGMFKINNVTPTSYRQGRYHRCSIELIRYVDAEYLKKIEDGVRDTMYFDKNVYIGEGDYTFLTHESFINLQDLKDKKKELFQYYTSKFYQEEWESFVCPDGIYDPYIVEFLRQRFSLKEIKKRPLQLYSRLRDYDKSFWYMLTNSHYHQTFSHISPVVHSVRLQAEALATDLNALINRYYLALGEGSNTTPYVFSSNFYSGQTALMTPLERAVHDYVVNRKISVSSVLNLVSSYREGSDYDQFYQIPVLIELISVAISSISS